MKLIIQGGVYKAFLNFSLANKVLCIVSRTRLQSFCNHLVANGIIDECGVKGKLDKTYFKIRDKHFFIVEEGIYGQLGWKFSSRSSSEVNFAFHILDHCNLNCQMCNKFSPLAKERYVSQNVILEDAKKLCELTDGQVKRLIITGGEPLLHPELDDILIGIHALFPNILIQLQTNGLLLPKKGKDFYDLCTRNNVVIWLTKYPIDFDYESAVNDLELCGCKVMNAVDAVKTSWKFPIDINGRQPMFLTLFCWMHSECINVIEGKITPCGFMHASRCFEEKFGVSFERSADDVLDMYKVRSWSEVDRYLRRIQPFCRYCDIENREEDIPWRTSSQDMSEWTNNIRRE